MRTKTLQTDSEDVATDDSHNSDLCQGQIVAVRIPGKHRDVTYIYMAEVSAQSLAKLSSVPWWSKFISFFERKSTQVPN